jgi:hypothetical protein
MSGNLVRSIVLAPFAGWLIGGVVRAAHGHWTPLFALAGLALFVCWYLAFMWWLSGGCK